ncbi:unnamed protein product [Calypogeia fissa]
MTTTQSNSDCVVDAAEEGRKEGFGFECGQQQAGEKNIQQRANPSTTMSTATSMNVYMSMSIITMSRGEDYESTSNRFQRGRNKGDGTRDRVDRSTDTNVKTSGWDEMGRVESGRVGQARDGTVKKESSTERTKDQSMESDGSNERRRGEERRGRGVQYNWFQSESCNVVQKAEKKAPMLTSITESRAGQSQSGLGWLAGGQ